MLKDLNLTPFFGTPKSLRIWFDLRRCPLGGGGGKLPRLPPLPLRGNANDHSSGSANRFETSVLYFTHSQSMLLFIFKVGNYQYCTDLLLITAFYSISTGRERGVQ